MKDSQIFNIFDPDNEPSDEQLSKLMDIVAQKVSDRAKKADQELFEGIRSKINQIPKHH